ncbi:Hypothetical protein CAP_0955 [Chondromyces apiculatus DSM 436]|uniref:Uncharacterized protein n=1 Tax=Chondromyces apiculatus DSM 436 TaxID=1192034 RepID=A0A017STH1_9BACT|nr:Hypothetical protein CAP_0955 [Chondromyces apiculatus DSM 436]
MLDFMRFVLTAMERHHVLLLDPEWNSDDDAQSIQRLLQSMPAAIRAAVHEKLEESLDASANMGMSVARIRVEPIPESQWVGGVLSHKDALQVMQTPLWLVLENGRNDLEFLRRILVRSDREKLNAHLAEGRIEVPLGGGTGELKAFLENLATLPDQPSDARDITDWIRRLRSWAMLDRDVRAATKDQPSDPTKPSKTSETLRQLCAGMARPRPFPGHQLSRRTIENYLPFEALERWVSKGKGPEIDHRSKLLKAFRSSMFGDVRRACFNMKEGLLKDVAHGLRKEVKQSKRRPTEAELPLVFQGCEPKVEGGAEGHLVRRSKRHRRARRWNSHSDHPPIRHLLKNGFGDDICKMYGDKGCEDHWFWEVFVQDRAAQAWRDQLVESLWAVL